MSRRAAYQALTLVTLVAITAAALWAFDRLDPPYPRPLDMRASSNSLTADRPRTDIDFTVFRDDVWPDGSRDIGFTKEPAQATVSASTLELLALQSGEGATDICAALYVIASDSIKLARKGETIAEALVEDVDSRGVTIREGDRVYRLELGRDAP